MKYTFWNFESLLGNKGTIAAAAAKSILGLWETGKRDDKMIDEPIQILLLCSFGFEFFSAAEWKYASSASSPLSGWETFGFLWSPTGKSMMHFAWPHSLFAAAVSVGKKKKKQRKGRLITSFLKPKSSTGWFNLWVAPASFQPLCLTDDDSSSR